MLNISNKRENETLTVALEGRLDTATALQLESDISGNIDGVEELIIDMERLDYISSAGLRVILEAQKIMNVQGCMKVVRPNDLIMEIFDDTGFSNILTFV